MDFKNDISVNGNITSSGVALPAGSIISEFSTDGTFTDNSDTAVPTEKAVRTYVETVSGNIAINSINDVGDVSISLPVDTQVLKYSGGQWINADVGAAEISLEATGVVTSGKVVSIGSSTLSNVNAVSYVDANAVFGIAKSDGPVVASVDSSYSHNTYGYYSITNLDSYIYQTDTKNDYTESYISKYDLDLNFISGIVPITGVTQVNDTRMHSNGLNLFNAISYTTGGQQYVKLYKYDSNLNKLNEVYVDSGAVINNANVFVTSTDVYVCVLSGGPVNIYRFDTDLNYSSGIVVNTYGNNVGTYMDKYIYGDSTNIYFGAILGTPNCFLVKKYDTDLNFIDEVIYKSGLIGNSEDIDLHVTDNYVWTCYKNDGTPDSYYITKFDRDLNVASETIFSGIVPGGGNVRDGRIAIADDNGPLYFTSRDSTITSDQLAIVKYDSSLNRLDLRNHAPDTATEITFPIIVSGNLYVGYENTDNPSYISIIKFGGSSISGNATIAYGGPITDIFNDLTPGSKYYFDASGVLTTTPGRYIGYAPSSSSLYFDQGNDDYPQKITMIVTDNSTGNLGSSSASYELFEDINPKNQANIYFTAGDNDPAIITSTSGDIFNTSVDNAGTINIYVSAGNLTVQNKTGSDKTFSVYRKI